MDPLHPKIVRVMDALLKDRKVVVPVDVIVRMGLLEPKRIEDWRFGRVPYLERVINCNLAFTKTGDPGIEEAFATHFVWPGKRPTHPPEAKAGKEHGHEAA